MLRLLLKAAPEQRIQAFVRRPQAHRTICCKMWMRLLLYMSYDMGSPLAMSGGDVAACVSTCQAQ